MGPPAFVCVEGVSVVAEDQEFHPLRVVHALLTGCPEPQRGDHRALLTGCLAGRVRVSLDRAGDDLAGDSFGDQILCPLRKVSGDTTDETASLVFIFASMSLNFVTLAGVNRSRPSCLLAR